MDPYKTLGISPSATDDEVRKAYRELARKYHPDNYVNNPLADLAQEKMQQINDAYDTITKQRQNGGTSGGYTSQSSSYGSSYGGSYGGNAYSSTYSGPNASVYNQVRNAINVGNVSMAEELLSRVSQRDAEWHYLRAHICQRKGWFDEARQEVDQACAMSPNNLEYRKLQSILTANASYGGYRPMQDDGAANCCAQLLCLNCLCNCMGGGGC